MAKRRTIGDNPLDTIDSGPATLPPETVPKPVVALVPAPRLDDLVERIETLEQENQCMRWLVGAVLAPLAVLALLL